MDKGRQCAVVEPEHTDDVVVRKEEEKILPFDSGIPFIVIKF